MQDFRPAFCEDCGTYIGVMEDQHGALYLICACPDGRHELEDETLEWVQDRVGGDDDA